MDSSLILTGFLASLAAGAATGLGALPILKMGEPDARQQNMLLGFAAGVMLAASVFSLIIPGIRHAERLGATPVEALLVIGAAVVIGAMVLAQLNAIVSPRAQLALGPEALSGRPSPHRVGMFVAAITLHNFPEGLAVGVSFGTGDPAIGTATALGIGLQNIPEGLAVAGALASIGWSPARAALGALATGLVEPIAGLAGVSLVSLAEPLLPWGLGFAAGAMLYIVATEIIPETYVRLAGGRPATLALIAGLCSMTLLDTTLG